VLVLTYLVDPIAPLQVKALQAAAPLLGEGKADIGAYPRNVRS